MATRSTIAVQHTDGSVSQIYSHWDGYVSHHGPLLRDYYGTLDLAEALVALGALSSLQESITPTLSTHSFDSPEDGQTVFYGRDRGDEGVGSEKFSSIEEYIAKGRSEGYEYLFSDGEWKVCLYFGDTNLFHTIADALKLEAAR